MNQVNLIGRITNDLELKETPNGKKYVEFSLAVDEYINGNKGVQFIKHIAWEKLAENLIIYIKKGNQLQTTGSLSVKFDNERKTTYVSIRVEKVTFIGNKEPKQEHPAQTRIRHEDTRPAPDSDILKNSNILWED